ncbi:MAG: glycosyltransferase [Spirochaetales bacterium]|nr:glycosyltransferase [Spirochaetales bacterium]
MDVLSIQDVSIRCFFKCKKPFALRCYTNEGIRIWQQIFPATRYMRWLKRLMAFILGLYIYHRYRKENGAPDLIHVHIFDSGPLARFLKNHHNIPYIVTEHSSAFARGLLNSAELKSARKTYDESSYNLAVSESFQQEMEGFFSSPFSYVPNVVDSHSFPLNDTQKKSCYTFLNVAELDANKNHILMIRSFGQVYKGNDQYQLVIAGMGPEYHSLKQLIEELGLDDQVSLYGEAQRHDVCQLMKEADCFVLTSHYETFGVVLIEALSCGVPVISTCSGGPQSIIQSPSIGQLCDHEQDLTCAFRDMPLRDFDPQEIRNYAIAHFSGEAVARQLYPYYLSAVTAQKNRIPVPLALGLLSSLSIPGSQPEN